MTRFADPVPADRPCRAVVRRCAGAPVLAVLSGCTPALAAWAAWLWCRSTRTYGFLIEVEALP